MEKYEKYSKEWHLARSKKLHEVIDRYKKEDAERERLKKETFEALSPEEKEIFLLKEKERWRRIAEGYKEAVESGVIDAV